MSGTCEITILNKSGRTQSYMLFAEIPKVAGSGKVFQNVFMTAPPIVSRPNGSSSTNFILTRQHYAICGTSVAAPADGVQVATSDYEAVTLGTDTVPGTTLNFTKADGAANFTNPLGTPTAPAGAYTISTDSSFTVPDRDNSFVGMGARNATGRVVPTAIFLALPAVTYTIKPVAKYYIATGFYISGQAINVQEIGTTQLCDFTDPACTSLTFNHDNNGQYTSVPSYQARRIKLAALQAAKSAMLSIENAPAPTYQNGNGPMYAEAQLALDLKRVLLKLIQAENTVSA